MTQSSLVRGAPARRPRSCWLVAAIASSLWIAANFQATRSPPTGLATTDWFGYAAGGFWIRSLRPVARRPGGGLSNDPASALPAQSRLATGCLAATRRDAQPLIGSCSKRPSPLALSFGHASRSATSCGTTGALLESSEPQPERRAQPSAPSWLSARMGATHWSPAPWARMSTTLSRRRHAGITPTGQTPR